VFNKRSSIAILIPYFGAWPVWINFFIESCRANKTIDWILFSDADPPDNQCPNVKHVKVTFPDYRRQISQALGVEVGAEAPYKLCDVRPALALIHAELVRGYDFVGFGDLDVIYGDIRSIYDEGVLTNYDLLSTSPTRVSGHFCLMRNHPDIVTAFRRAPGWKDAMARTDYVNFDERAFYKVFRGTPARLLQGFGAPSVRCFFREAYSTPAATSEMRWYWKDGRLSNEFYPDVGFMYLHFMYWHSDRWLASQAHVRAGAAAPWSQLDEIVRMDWRDARSDGFMISPAGIEPITPRSFP
jgi:hypothetical protein